MLLSPRDIKVFLPPQVSPFGAEAEAEAFARRWLLVPPNFAGYHSMSRYFYPHAVSADRLASACMVHDTFFLLDEVFIDTVLNARDFGMDLDITRTRKGLHRFFEKLIESFVTQEVSKSTPQIFQAFAELGGIVARHTNDEWFSHFVVGLQNYIQAALERGDSRTDVTSTLEKFLRIRVRDGGGLHTCQLIELAKDAFLPADVRCDPMITQMTTAAIGMASFVNDVYSYHKDVINEGSDFNLVHVLMEVGAYDFSAAIDQSVKLINAYVDEFIDALAELRSWGDERDAIAESYVNGLVELMAGNVHWHRTAERYKFPGSPFEEIRTLVPSTRQEGASAE